MKFYMNRFPKRVTAQKNDILFFSFFDSFKAWENSQVKKECKNFDSVKIEDSKGQVTFFTKG